MSYEKFFLELERECLKLAKALNKAKTIRFVSHLDADGLCSASIIAKLLRRYNKEFHLSIVKQLESEKIDELEKEKYETYLFTDIGSGQLQAIKKLLDKNQVIIIDHHPTETEFNHPNLVHVNPHKQDIDGGQDICASTLSYFIAKNFNLPNCEHLAIVGSIGDTQEEKGVLNGVNKLVLENIDENIEIRKGLRVFGRISKPIQKAIAYSTADIPGVSGDESSAIQFLSEIGLDIKKDEEFRNMNDLSDEEEKKLITNIIMRRLDTSKNPDDITGNIYIFKNKKWILKDAHEFATLLNSCGRQNMQGVGLMLCLDDEKAIEMGKEIMSNYKRKLLKALKWVKSNSEDTSKIYETENAMYIKGGDKIDDTLIGTICSIKSSDEDFKKDMIVGFANSTNGVKVSGRIASDIDLNIGEAIKKASATVNGEGGGHGKAGGAKIEMGSEDRFIAEFEKTIKNIKGQQIVDLAD